MTPSSRGLGHRPFTAVTRVRLPLGSPKFKERFSRLSFLFSKITVFRESNPTGFTIPKMY